MTGVETKVTKKPGVSSLWRTATVCLLAGMGLHWWVARTHTAPAAQGLTIRGDPLPDEKDYDPRLDQVLDAVDFENVPLPEALLSIAKRSGICLVLTTDVTNSGGYNPPQPPPLVTALHLKHVKAGDALNAVLRSVELLNIDVRTCWTEAHGHTMICTLAGGYYARAKLQPAPATSSSGKHRTAIAKLNASSRF